MKKFNLTKLEEYFSITEIVTIFHIKEVTNRNKPDIYNFWQLFYVYDGEWKSKVDSMEYSMKSGQIIFRAPGEKHCPYNNETFSCEAAIVSFTCNSPALDYFKQKIFTLTYEEKNLLFEIINIGVRSFTIIADDPLFFGLKLKENISKATIHYIKSSLERFLLMLYIRNNDVNLPESTYKTNTYNKNKELVQSVIIFMEDNISKNLTIDDISRHFAVSCSSIRNTFKEITGKSVMKYFIDMKIDKAKNMIIDTSMTFAQISYALGFYSPDYFTKTFKAKTGKTPSEYSKLLTNNSSELM